MSRDGLLGSYLAEDGALRELVCLPAARGSRLVLDRRCGERTEGRLLAHLAPDEPEENAGLLVADYLDHGRGRCCRPVRPADFLSLPPELIASRDDLIASHDSASHERASDRVRLGSCAGGLGVFRLGVVPSLGRGPASLRWIRTGTAGGREQIVSLRHVVGELQSYDPARANSAAAVHGCDNRPGVSVAALRAELARLAASRIVLNRLLREAVIRALAQGATLSQIAARCGRVKRDARGNLSGETSWLARRLGLLPEAGNERPTSWIHSDVLAVIARRGLGVSPREVELG